MKNEDEKLREAARMLSRNCVVLYRAEELK